MRSLNINERPYTELFDGEVRVKMPPSRGHGLVQVSLAEVLRRLAGEHGFVATEVHMWIGAADASETVFVPDIEFTSRERIQAERPDVEGVTEFAPDIAVEVRLPRLTARDLERKIAKYLACGTRLVLDVDPNARSIVAHRADGVVRRFERDDEFEDEAFPWLRFEVAEAFNELDRFESVVRQREGESPP
jgi:Uma2 family endonuclease